MNEMPRWIDGPFVDDAGNVVIVWTEAEVADLQRLYLEGYGTRRIAELLGRGRQSVRNKLDELGLKKPVSGEQANDQQQARENYLKFKELCKAPPCPTNADWVTRKIASDTFLIALLRAGHKPGCSDLRIGPDRTVMLRATPALPNFSVTGSHF